MKTKLVFYFATTFIVATAFINGHTDSLCEWLITRKVNRHPPSEKEKGRKLKRLFEAVIVQLLFVLMKASWDAIRHL